MFSMKFIYNGQSRFGGVYKITNNETGNFYIGSSYEFKRRASQHRNSLKKNRHSNKHLQASWNKWGEDAFLFEVIEVVHGDKGERFRVEQKYIDNLIKKGLWKQTFNFKKKTIQKERSCFSNTPEETKKKRIETTMKRYGKPFWAQTKEAKPILKKVGKRKPTKEEIEKSASKRRGKKNDGGSKEKTL